MNSTNSVFMTSAKQRRLYRLYYNQRSHGCDPTLHQASTEANYVLVKTRLANGLRSLKENTTTLQRAQAAVWDYTTWSASSSRGRPPLGSVVSSVKHKLSKREYKDVLSKTYKELDYSCTGIKVKGGWGLT